ncbi:MAG: endonuclease [Phenylobacterium sp.]|nr:endonuclease [Phenylobacterium sp.]
MPKYWWVNHNTTFEHEIDGGYLWSPQREARARSTSYDNMRRVQPGDLIVSYARQCNSFIGKATDFAIAAPKPTEFGTKGSYWSDIGWYVPIAWTALPTIVRHRDFWDDFAPHLPKKFSPVVASTRRGNQKLYLAEISEDLFTTVFARSGLALSRLINHAAGRNAAEVAELLEADAEAAIRDDAGLEATVRAQLVAARRGQGKFRAAVRELSPRCRVTGVEYDALLVASHIKPWRSCSSAEERLDGNNGLMLAPHIDRLFDRGFITFEDNGSLHVSGHIGDDLLEALGCPGLRSLVVEAFSPAQRAYLAHHREHEFLLT